jgi:hypothetical protein
MAAQSAEGILQGRRVGAVGDLAAVAAAFQAQESGDPLTVPPMTTLPPPPPTEKPSGTTSTFPPPTAAQVVRALRAPAVGYAWLLLGAVMMMVLIVVAANVGSTGDETGVESDDTNAIGVLIGMPFQIAGMALLGSLHFT